jgi:hypothetical protein
MKAQAAMERLLARNASKAGRAREPIPRDSRSQAAMEFLLTYGWAIVVVVLAISTLAYFGVLNPHELLSYNSCHIQGGLSCMDHSVIFIPPPLPGLDGKNDLLLRIQNNKGFDYRITDVDIEELANKHQGYWVMQMDNGQQITLSVDNLAENDASLTMESGETYDIDFIITAENTETELPVKFRGHIKGKVN